MGQRIAASWGLVLLLAFQGGLHAQSEIAASGWILRQRTLLTSGANDARATASWEPQDGYLILAECRAAGLANAVALEENQRRIMGAKAKVTRDDRSISATLPDREGSLYVTRYLCFPSNFDPRGDSSR